MRQAYRKEERMTDNTPTKRRTVSKPRMLKSLLATLDEYGIGQDQSIAKLIEAMQMDIIKAAMGE